VRNATPQLECGHGAVAARVESQRQAARVANRIDDLNF